MNRIFIILCTLLTIYVAQTQSLKCYSNIGEHTDECDVPDDKESACYKSAVEDPSRPEFGCLDGGLSLGHLQCKTNTLKHHIRTYIECCRDQDYCNLGIPDPDPKLDPRWEISDSTGPLTFDFQKVWQFSLILLIIILICIILRLVAMSRSCSKTIPSIKGSNWTLGGDIDKFPHAASSSVSTHSCSISDDSCHKIEDVTSGTGENELKQRTMARAIGCGITDHVGNGRFGRVFRGQYHGEDVAVKAFRSVDGDSWKREDSIFRTLNHENVVRFLRSELTTADSGTEFWMFLEYCPFGSLCDFLDKNEILGTQQAVKILYSIINGLNYLHEDYDQASGRYKPSIAHRDIKSKNILMKTPESCCIADFGHALVKIDEQNLDYGQYKYLQVGTVRYMAPEILKPNFDLYNYRQFSTFAQADLYQFGLILWEVCHRTALDVLHPADNHKLPYDDVVPQNPDILDMIKIVCVDQYRPPRYDKWEKYPLMKRLADLMVECWRPKPTARMETLGVKKKLKEMYNAIYLT